VTAEREVHVLQNYPKWKYHRSGRSIIVNDADAEAALGEGWSDSPNPYSFPLARTHAVGSTPGDSIISVPMREGGSRKDSPMHMQMLLKAAKRTATVCEKPA
jgi:hypothetical protein